MVAKREKAAKDRKAANINIVAQSLIVDPATGLLVPDYFGSTPNYANSPLPVLDVNGNVTPGTGIRKFVDSLPGLGPAGANNLGNYIPVAVPDQTTYPGSDYYEIELGQYTQKMHSDLPVTTLRGYRQTNMGGTPFSYLGPLIIAQKDRPVRVKFTNSLPTDTGGNLFLPVDTTVMGSGMFNINYDPVTKLPGPTLTGNFTENRATLHLHGGNTPWISDGTQHQWITPAEENTQYPQGVSVAEVPDMSGAGCGSATDGCQTFYYTNQQSARLMFYHDHAYGITRLNVYAGEAAGYLLQDSAEAGMVSSGIIPTDQIPLIIQDKTFVPDSAQLNAQDPTWDTAKYGGKGNLWFPHVYMPNQNPDSTQGANPMGRWDYGPWFWPVFNTINPPVPNPYYDPVNAPWEPSVNPGIPNPSIVPEAFMDTAMVNGVAYPNVTLEPKPYRLRILNAANDRFLNLQLYLANSSNPMWDENMNLVDANAGEVHMVPFNSNQNLITPFPEWWYTPGLNFVFDDRAGGVPDPTMRGPAMIQIGTEGGFLPAPQVILNQPINYVYNRRDIVVLNVNEKALFLGPAERADVIVDFSNFAGKTLILYNDAPAPVPALDPRVDYYTGNMNQTDTGGAPTTLPGYGPNTRTIMQIKVSGSGGLAPVDDVNQTILTGLQTELPAAYNQTQDKPIVPQAEYNTAFSASYPVDAYARIQSTKMTFLPAVLNEPVRSLNVTSGGSGYVTAPNVTIAPPAAGVQATASATLGFAVGNIAVTNGGKGYTSVPTVTLTGGGGIGATATATIIKGKITSIAVTNGGLGYTSAPTVTLTGGGGTGAAAKATLAPTGSVKTLTLLNGGSGYVADPIVLIAPPITGTTATATASINITMDIQPKAIHELFDPDYGRMNSLLGVEMPFTDSRIQTTIPYTDIDSPTEIFKNSDAAAPLGTLADGTQIWKITHNGVDTHAIHWHMFNVQVINRVGWDGAIRPPDPNELGWKDTVRMNPLEDIIVAMRPIIPNLPFDVPNSIRPMDVTAALGTTTQFGASTNYNAVDPRNNPITVTNHMMNYGWEFVWHCHLLGHEENIMMRPIIATQTPREPLNLVAAKIGSGNNQKAVLTWTDNSSNEVSWIVQKASAAAGPWTTIANPTSTTGPGKGSLVTYTTPAIAKKTTVYFRVIAVNIVGDITKYPTPAIGYPNMEADSAPSNQAVITTV